MSEWNGKERRADVVYRPEFDSLAGIVQQDHAKVRQLEVAAEGVRHGMERLAASQERLEKALVDHMSREEGAFRDFYRRVEKMDDELKLSFDKRDAKINQIDKQQIKLLAYATAIYAALSLVIQAASRLV